MEMESQLTSIPKDTDPFPFGKHKGTPYGEVPASYLDWISQQNWLPVLSRVRAYIDYNRAALDKELEDA